MTKNFKIVAKRGNERQREIIGTEADIKRFEKSGYEVKAEPTDEILTSKNPNAVVVKINTQAADIIASRLIEKMKEEGLIVANPEKAKAKKES